MKEVAYFLRRLGPALVVVGVAVLTALSISYPFPGSWNASVATPEMPLRGFWLAVMALVVAASGFGMWLAALGMEDRR